MSSHQMWAHSEQKLKMRLASSASDQNVYFTYVCLINDYGPEELKYKHLQYSLYTHAKDTQEENKEEEPIQIGRTKALHELIESHNIADATENIQEQDKKNIKKSDSSICNPTTSGVNSTEPKNNERKILSGDTLNILKLTKMKWLTEDQEETPDVRSLSSSPTESSSSICSIDSDNKVSSIDEKYLSTILRLDKEHNMFGLSNITIVGSNQMKKKRKTNDKPVFHQNAIVQICCAKNCCRHKSNTDLPSSLKCGVCKGCCLSCVDSCVGVCPPPCTDPPCSCSCSKCAKGQCCSKKICKAPKCLTDCVGTCFGLKVTLHRKPEKPPPPNVEVTPRSSCLQQLPLAARSCHHLPHCIPPSTCFPYLMPCFWPVRSSAPCNTPTHCFHHPPCIAPRWRTPQAIDTTSSPPIPPGLPDSNSSPLRTLSNKGKKCTEERKDDNKNGKKDDNKNDKRSDKKDDKNTTH